MTAVVGYCGRGFQLILKRLIHPSAAMALSHTLAIVSSSDAMRRANLAMASGVASRRCRVG
jgi:hypothetical protein